MSIFYFWYLRFHKAPQTDHVAYKKMILEIAQYFDVISMLENLKERRLQKVFCYFRAFVLYPEGTTQLELVQSR